MKTIIDKCFDIDYPKDSDNDYVGGLYDVYEKAFMTAWRIGFDNGYSCACANLVKSHGEDSIAEDILKCNLNVENISEDDLDVLMPIIKEIERKKSTE
jgi:hypothetical protein